MDEIIYDGQTSKKVSLLKFVDYNENYGRHIIKEFCEFLSSNQNLEKICDLGVGFGNDLSIAKNYFQNAQLYGIDFSEQNSSTLKNLGIELIVTNIENEELPFQNNTVDLFICNQVLEHTKELFWIFHQLSVKLKVGGFVIIGVPNMASLINRLLFLFGKQPSTIHTYSAHIRGFTHNEIPKFLNVCFPDGYRIRIMRGSNFYPFPRKLSRFFSKIFPSLSHCSFVLIEKVKEYNDEFINHPQNAKLETNFYIGK